MSHWNKSDRAGTTLFGRFSKLPIVWKFVWINAAIFILITVLMLSNNKINSLAIKREIIDGNTRYMEYITEIISKNIDSVNNLHYQFYNNNDLEYLQSQYDYDGESVVRMLRLKSILSVFNMITPISSDLCLYFDRLGMVINTAGTCKVDTNFSSALQEHISQKSYYNLYKGYIGLCSGESMYTICEAPDWSEEQYYLIFDLSEENYGMALFITLNTCELSNIIHSANYNENNLFLLLDQERNYIAGDVDNIPEGVTVKTLIENIYNNRSEVADEYIITENTLDSGQLYYITLYPYSEIEAKVAQQDRVFIIFYTALIILELIGMAIYYFIFILPVKTLYRKIDIKDRKSDEISAISTAYLEMNEEVQTNHVKINMQYDMLFELWLQRIANGMLSEKEISENIEYNNRIKGYCAIYIVVAGTGVAADCLQDIIASLNVQFEVYLMTGNPQKTATLLVCCSDTAEYQLVGKVIKETVQVQPTHMKCFAGISGFKMDIQILSQAIAESSNALFSSSEMPANLVCIYDEKEKKPQIDSFQIKLKDENRLMSAIFNNDTAQIKELLSEVFRVHYPLEYNRQALTYLLFMRNIVMNTMNIDMDNLLVTACIKHENTADDFFLAEDMREYIQTQMIALAEIVNSNKEFPCSQILEFIHQKFDSMISLEVVADQFNLSAAYFSRYFKKLTGDNFVVYVNRLRIEKARYLLEKTDMLLKEISEKTGFNNNRYFIKVFKQYEGITPSEYRQIRAKK